MNRNIHNQYFKFQLAGLVGMATLLAASLPAQQHPKTFVVNGKNAGPVTMQSRGRTYIDVETLAQAVNGSVTYQPDRVILTIPAGSAVAAADATQPPPVMSREFASAALAEVALMREWKGAIETMISLQLPATGTFFQEYQDRADEGLRQASVAASTAPDHQGFQLLQNEFSNLAKWAGNAVATRQALNATRTLSPDVLKNDADLQKISACAQFLSSMLVTLNFADNPSCH